ncbi:MAG: hypothetical protein P1V51_07020 [Deltaproteobacteria bacterium]|nr:hypothetical protein [Deltaproteobacteria bacterium]
MSTAASPPRPSLTRGRSGATRVLLGCAIVAGVFFFGSCLLAGGAALYLATTPGQIELASLVDDEAIGVLFVEANLEDPGVEAVVDTFFDALAAAQRESAERAGLPAPLRFLQQAGNSSNRQQLGWLFPIEGIVVLHPGEEGEEGEPTVVGAINLDHLPRMYARSLDWISALEEGSAKEEFVEHRGRTILDGPDGAFSLLGGSILMATGLEPLKRSLDHLDAAGEAGARGSELGQALAALRGPGDATGVLRLDVPLIRSLALAALEGDPQPSAGGAALGECQRLEGFIDLIDADTLRLHLELRCSADPFGWDELMELGAAGLKEALAGEGLELTYETRESEGAAPGVLLEGELRGLREAVLSSLDPPGSE